ncbi:hypothetical protein GCM10017783_25400 [Deinococcus piscis]|uniref:Uncharacterized protein n=1 Tax=Deinococcus piscis TaxID=394230 RepID=A0ABQ3KC99_9DEIO|nr:hypothetical protein GCM10017783_25400 [Deinococcus piscis]
MTALLLSDVKAIAESIRANGFFGTIMAQESTTFHDTCQGAGFEFSQVLSGLLYHCLACLNVEAFCWVTVRRGEGSREEVGCQLFMNYKIQRRPEIYRQAH